LGILNLNDWPAPSQKGNSTANNLME